MIRLMATDYACEYLEDVRTVFRIHYPDAVFQIPDGPPDSEAPEGWNGDVVCTKTGDTLGDVIRHPRRPNSGIRGGYYVASIAGPAWGRGMDS